MFGRIRKGKLIIEIPVQEPKLSRTGKTLVVASSRGVRRSSLKIAGEPVFVVANAYIHPDELPHQPTKTKKKSASKKSRAPSPTTDDRPTISARGPGRNRSRQASVKRRS